MVRLYIVYSYCLIFCVLLSYLFCRPRMQETALAEMISQTPLNWLIPTDPLVMFSVNKQEIPSLSEMARPLMTHGHSETPWMG